MRVVDRQLLYICVLILFNSSFHILCTNKYFIFIFLVIEFVSGGTSPPRFPSHGFDGNSIYCRRLKFGFHVCASSWTTSSLPHVDDDGVPSSAANGQLTEDVSMGNCKRQKRKIQRPTYGTFNRSENANRAMNHS